MIVLVPGSGIKANGNGTPKANVDDLIDVLMEQSGLKDNSEALGKLQSVLGTLSKKQRQYKNEQDFVEYLYYFTHRKLFKKYEQYPSLAETLTLGSYDCLTATTVYSILLNELSISHSVVETNYHIYILVYPDTESEILLEATDPNYGFKVDKDEIDKLKLVYREANEEIKEGQAVLGLNVERRLEGKEIIGLLYYNISIKELNAGNFNRSEELARQANRFYPNMRIAKLLEYIDTRIGTASL